MNNEQIIEILKKVAYPGLSRDIVSFGLVKKAEVSADGNVAVEIAVTTSKPEIPEQLQNAVESALKTAGVPAGKIFVEIKTTMPAAPGSTTPPPPQRGSVTV